MTDSNDTKMIATQNAEAVKMLEALLANGALASQYEASIEEIRNGKDNFYASLLAKEGKDAAEAQLDELNRSKRWSDFASTIELVAHGMLALAQVDSEGEYTKVVEDPALYKFPRCHEIYVPTKMIVVYNLEAPGYSQPEGSDNWGRHGRLGLKAVTLHAGHDYRGVDVAQLGLVLPQRALSAKNMSEDGFTVATINLEGRTDGHSHSPRGFIRDGYLKYSLGLLDMEKAVNRFSFGGGLDDAIGFPGATDYLANNLPQLGKYFADLATMLPSGHEH